MRKIVSSIGVLMGCLLLYACEDPEKMREVTKLRIEKKNKQYEVDKLKEQFNKKQQKIVELNEQLKATRERYMADLTQQLVTLRTQNIDFIKPITEEQIKIEHDNFEKEASTFISDELSKVSVSQCDTLIKKGESLQCNISLKIEELDDTIRRLNNKQHKLQDELENISSKDIDVIERIQLLVGDVIKQQETRKQRSQELQSKKINLDGMLGKLRTYRNSLSIYEQKGGTN